MEKVTFDRSHKKLPSMLGISKERLIELEAHCEKALIKLDRETKQSERIGYNSTRIIEEFISAAANEQELVFLTADATRTIFQLREAQEEVIPPSLMELIQKIGMDQEKTAQEKKQSAKQS